MTVLSADGDLQKFYRRIDNLHAHFETQKKVDPTGRCINLDNLRFDDNLTSSQLNHRNELLAYTFLVKGKDGQPYFKISIGDLIKKIQEIVSNMPGVQIQDIVLVGSAANALLESDPAFLISIAKILDKDAPVDGIAFQQLEVNDFDIRIYLIGADYEKRTLISNQLIIYYVHLAKKQYLSNLARLTAAAFLEEHNNEMIRSFKNDIRGTRKVSNERAWTKAKELFADEEIPIGKIISTSIRRHFKGKLKLKNALNAKIMHAAVVGMRNAVFGKLKNVSDSTKMTVQSFEKVEIILIEELERENISSSDSTQASLLSGKFILDSPQQKQGVVDRLLHRNRLTQTKLYPLDFFKLVNHARQGQSLPEQKELSEAIKVFANNFGTESTNRVKYFQHLKNCPYKQLILVLGCCAELEREGFHTEKIALVREFKQYCRVSYKSAWLQVIDKILNEKNLSWQEIEAIIISVSAIALSSGMSSHRVVDVFVRSSSQNGTLVVSLKKEPTCPSTQHFTLPWKAKESLEVLIKLILKTKKLPSLFYDLYEVMMGEKKDPLILLLESLEQIQKHGIRSEDSLNLWIKVLQNKLNPEIRKKALGIAEEGGVFSAMGDRDVDLWPHVSLKIKTEHLLNMLAQSKSSKVWILINLSLKTNVEEGRALLNSITEELLKKDETFRELQWHYMQLLDHLTSLDNAKTKLAIIQKLFDKNYISFALKGIEKLLISDPGLCKANCSLITSVIEEGYPVQQVSETIKKFLLDNLSVVLNEYHQKEQPLKILQLVRWSSKQVELPRSLEAIHGQIFAYFRLYATLNDNDVQQLLKILPNIAENAREIEKKLLHPFWQNLIGIFIAALKAKEFTISDKIVNSLPENTSWREIFSEIYAAFAEDLTPNYRDVQPYLFRQDLPKSVAHYKSFVHVRENCLIKHIKLIPMEAIEGYFRDASLVSPELWHAVLLKLAEVVKNPKVDFLLAQWKEYGWNKQYWENRTDLWIECLLLVQKINPRDSSFLKSQQQIFEHSSHPRYAELVIGFLTNVSKFKISIQECEVIETLRKSLSQISSSVDRDIIKCFMKRSYALPYAVELLSSLLNSDFKAAVTILKTEECRSSRAWIPCYYAWILSTNFQKKAAPSFQKILKYLPVEVLTSKIFQEHFFKRIYSAVHSYDCKTMNDLFDRYVDAILPLIDPNKEIQILDTRPLGIKQRIICLRADKLSGTHTTFFIEIILEIVEMLHSAYSKGTSQQKESLVTECHKYTWTLYQLNMVESEFMFHLERLVYLVKPSEPFFTTIHSPLMTIGLNTYHIKEKLVSFPEKMQEFYYYCGVTHDIGAFFNTTALRLSKDQHVEALIRVHDRLAVSEDRITLNKINSLFRLSLSFSEKSNFIPHASRYFSYLAKVGHRDFIIEEDLNIFHFIRERFSKQEMNFSEDMKKYFLFTITCMHQICTNKIDLKLGKYTFLRQSLQFILISLPKLVDHYDQNVERIIANWFPLLLKDILSAKHSILNNHEKFIYEIINSPDLVKLPDHHILRALLLNKLLRTLLAVNSYKTHSVAEGIFKHAECDNIYKVAEEQRIDILNEFQKNNLLMKTESPD